MQLSSFSVVVTELNEVDEEVVHPAMKNWKVFERDSTVLFAIASG